MATQTKKHRARKPKALTRGDKLEAGLREALLLHEDSADRWQGLKQTGATDSELWQALKREFGSGGSAQAEAGFSMAWDGGAGFTDPPKFWIDQSAPGKAKPTLAGAQLVKMVRMIFAIPLAPAGGEKKKPFHEPTIEKCPPDCGHTQEEHDAFDAGLKAGEEIGPDAETDLQGAELEAWLAGHSVGVLNRDGDGDQANTTFELVSQYSAEELDAYDRGVMAGRNGGAIEEAPEGYDDKLLTAWRAGHAQGVIERAKAADASSRTFSKEVEIELDDHEIAEKARDLAIVREQIEQLASEQKRTVDGYKHRIGVLEEKETKLFDVIRHRRDLVELTVYEKSDFDRRVVETCRADSGEIVHSRPMTDRELQPVFPNL